MFPSHGASQTMRHFCRLGLVHSQFGAGELVDQVVVDK